MTRKKITFMKWTFSILLVTIISTGFSLVYFQNGSAIQLSGILKPEENKEADEQAEKIMRDMSNSLKSLKEFSFKSKGYFEIIDSTGKKEKMENSGELFVKRPDKIKIQRTGEKSDLEFYCDGDSIILYGKRKNLYSTSKAGSTLDKTLDDMKENLGIELPVTDFLYSDIYEGLMEDVVSGKYIGKDMIKNTACDHLSFTGKEVDWEIWIEDGAKKLPRKYLIISKQIEGKPEAGTEITKWDTDVKLNDKLFHFTPPKGAKKIDFLPNSQPQTKR